MPTFTPVDVVDMSKERDWAANLGMLDWDSTQIVFTKRTLIEFLKYTGTTVDTNFSNIQKLPKFATFGKLSAGGDTPSASASTEATSSPDTNATSSGQFKPSRRAPGGETHDLFSHYVDDDALASAPPKQETDPAADAGTSTTDSARRDNSNFWEPLGNNNRTQFKPTRRVRENPGGRDSVADIL